MEYIRFRPTPNPDSYVEMIVSSRAFKGESSTEIFHYHPAEPQGVVRTTALYTTLAGRKIQTGITVADGLGRAVAWPAN